MKIKYSSKFILLNLAFILPYSNAETFEPGWVYNAKIDIVAVQPNQYIQVTVDSASTIPNQGCSLNDGKTVELNPTQPHYKDQYAMLLAALMSQKNVDIYVAGCANALPYAQITRVNAN